MLLEDRTAIVYGVAAASAGAAAVIALADEGARCALVGTDPAALDAVAALARARGGLVETAVLDPADRAAVEDHLGALLRATGQLDVSVHLDPAAAAIRAVARHMARGACGVVVLLGDPAADRDRWGPELRRLGIRLVALPAAAAHVQRIPTIVTRAAPPSERNP